MYNDILTIGSVTIIHGYGLMIAIGIMAAILTASYRAGKKGLSKDAIYDTALLGMATGFIGAKLLFCILDIKAVIKNPRLIISGEGFVVYGGIIAGVLSAYIYCRVRKIVFLEYLDVLLPSVAIAQGFGRIGCFLAGCCYGKETESIFGIAFHNSTMAPNGVKLIPTQLFSSEGDFSIAGIIFICESYAERKGKKPGRGFGSGLYLILYSVGRFVIEFFRNDYRGSLGVLSTSQCIAIGTLLLGSIIFWRSRKTAEKKV